MPSKKHATFPKAGIAKEFAQHTLPSSKHIVWNIHQADSALKYNGGAIDRFLLQAILVVLENYKF